jgi:hypothetical protein
LISDLLLGGSTLLPNRFVLSLVVTLAFSTLALANSAPVNLSSFHSIGSGAHVEYAPSGHFSINGERAATVTFSPVKSYSFAGSSFLASSHGTISRKDGDWAVWHKPSTAAPLSAPEPGSLLLISTGVVGLIGSMRRKLQF